MERDLGERWIKFKKNLESTRVELGLSSKDIRNTHGEVQAILEGTGYFEREKWIKERIQEKHLRHLLKNQCAKKEDTNGEFGFENDREHPGQPAFII
jgi:heterodisulfide reductase subunit C